MADDCRLLSNRAVAIYERGNVAGLHRAESCGVGYEVFCNRKNSWHASQGNGAEGVPLCAAVFACSANTWERIALFFSRLAKNIPSLSVASGNTMSKICSAVPCSASLLERSASRIRDQGQGPSWRKLPSSISIRTRRRSGEVLAIRRQTQSPENSSAD